jgi:hypothetical protein
MHQKTTPSHAVTTFPRSRAPARRGFVAVVLTQMLFCTVFIGCEPPPSRLPPKHDATTKRVVAVAAAVPPSGRWPAIVAGARHYAADIGTLDVVEVIGGDPNAHVDPGLIEEVVAAGGEALCLFVAARDIAHRQDLIAAVELAHEQNLPIVVMGHRVDHPLVYGQVCADWPQGAEQLADALPEITSRRSFVLLHHDGRDELATRCYRRFKTEADTLADMHLLKQVNQAQQKAASTATARSLVALFPNAGLVVTLDDALWMHSERGWFTKLRAINPHVQYVALSSAPQLWRDLGTPGAPGVCAALVGPVEGRLGYEAVRIAWRPLIAEREPDGVLRFIDCELITPETLPDFAHRYAKAAGDLDVRPFLRGALDLDPAPPADGE